MTWYLQHIKEHAFQSTNFFFLLFFCCPDTIFSFPEFSFTFYKLDVDNGLLWRMFGEFVCIVNKYSLGFTLLALTHTGIHAYKYNIFILMPKQTFISCSVFHYIFKIFFISKFTSFMHQSNCQKKIIKRKEINFRNSVRYSRVAFNILKIYNTIWIKGCTILARSFLMLKEPHSAD